MSKILVHIHSGPDLKNKATLGMLVEVSAIKDGHDVSLFLAADGVHLLNCSETGKVVGKGTGDLKEQLDFLQSANTTLWVSGMSAKARGYDENLLEGFNAQFAMPNRLVEAPLKQIPFSVIDCFWISKIFRMGEVMKRVIPRKGDPPRITLRVSYNLPVLPWTWRQPQFFDQYREWSQCPGSCLPSMP